MGRFRGVDKAILFGGVLVVIGVGLVSFTAFRLPIASAFWPPLLVMLGAFMTWRVFQHDDREIFLFGGVLLIQVGVLGLINGWFPFVDIGRVWPLFMLMIGVTLLPYGYRKRRSNKYVFIIPGASIVLLSLGFLPFSLGLVKVGLRRFVLEWWPLAIVFLGLLILLSHFGGTIKESSNHSNEGEHRGSRVE